MIEQKEKTNNLAIVLPGAGYTTQAPLLHFTTALFYNKGFDILHINYKYNSQELSVLSEEDFTNKYQINLKFSNSNTYHKSNWASLINHLFNGVVI